MPRALAIYYVLDQHLLPVVSSQNGDLRGIVPYQHQVHENSHRKFRLDYVLVKISHGLRLDVAPVVHVHELVGLAQASVSETELILTVGKAVAESVQSSVFPGVELQYLRPRSPLICQNVMINP